jgi:hypothetical protein
MLHFKKYAVKAQGKSTQSTEEGQSNGGIAIIFKAR